MTRSSDGPRRLPRLHVVTDDRVFADRSFLARAEGVLRSGGADVALHLRAPRATGRALYDAATRLVAVARHADARLLVNGRVDVALAAGADGAQLPARGLPPAVARGLLGPDALIGASVHSADEAAAAAEGGASFLVAGTVYPSASHPGIAAAGPEALTALRDIGPPVIGIGGIDAARVPHVLVAGAYGVAVLGAVWDARDPGGAAAALVDILKEV